MSVQLGPVSLQPLRIRIPSVHGDTIVTVCGKSKLPSKDHLEAGRQALGKAIKEYVPETTTAKDWCKEFEIFCGSEPHSAELFSDFCALVYYRTTINKGVPGHLSVSSACTYLRYVTAKYKRYAAFPCFRAIETEAGSLGAYHKAPSVGDEHLQHLKLWFAQGPTDKQKVRCAAWLQTATGGRPIDISRLRCGGLVMDGAHVKSVEWKWTKSIKKAKDAKTVFPPKTLQEKIGPAPFDAKQWKAWGGKDGTDRPFIKYCAGTINKELYMLCEEYDEQLTSTSLRDIYNRLIAEICDNDAEAMLRYTPHKSAVSLKSSYLSGRSFSKRKAAKKSTVKAAKKTRK